IQNRVLPLAANGTVIWSPAFGRLTGFMHHYNDNNQPKATDQTFNVDITYKDSKGNIETADRFSQKRLENNHGRLIFCIEPDVAVNNNQGYNLSNNKRNQEKLINASNAVYW